MKHFYYSELCDGYGELHKFLIKCNEFNYTVLFVTEASGFYTVIYEEES